ncbi:MAG: hypothetical protein HQL52_20185 [Magnetococcales bacterium]|nr:hypothetical protein [Magnetococcales bacterium]
MTRKTLSLKKSKPGVKACGMPDLSPPRNRGPASKPNAKPKSPPSQPVRTKPPPSMVKALALLTTLEENHPELFPSDDTPPRPWAIGIHKTIQTEYKVSKRVAKKALGMWQEQNREAYQAALRAGSARYGLDGEPDGNVEEKG